MWVSIMFVFNEAKEAGIPVSCISMYHHRIHNVQLMPYVGTDNLYFRKNYGKIVCDYYNQRVVRIILYLLVVFHDVNQGFVFRNRKR